MEFPPEGLQWQRVCNTREALRALIRDEIGLAKFPDY